MMNSEPVVFSCAPERGVLDEASGPAAGRIWSEWAWFWWTHATPATPRDSFSGYHLPGLHCYYPRYCFLVRCVVWKILIKTNLMNGY